MSEEGSQIWSLTFKAKFVLILVFWKLWWFLSIKNIIKPVIIQKQCGLQQGGN